MGFPESEFCLPRVLQHVPPSAFFCKLVVGSRNTIRFWVSIPCLFWLWQALLPFAVSLKAASKPTGAPGGAPLLPTAAGEGGRAHRGEESAELCRHQHVPPVRDRAEQGGRGAGAGERAGADISVTLACEAALGWGQARQPAWCPVPSASALACAHP